MKRIFTGLMLIAAVASAFYLRGISATLFSAFTAIIAFVCVYELALALKHILGRFYFSLSLIYAALLWPAHHFLLAEGFLLLSAIAAVVAFIHFINEREVAASSLAQFFFIMIYPALFFYIIMQLNDNRYGLFLLFTAFIIGPVCDTLAFCTGSLLKGKKLCPHVSPNKTVSGAAGALAGGVIAGAGIYFVFQGLLADFAPPIAGNVWIMMVLGLFGAVLGIFGDLSESALKRRLEIKDFGNILPGHGGMLDRMDSIMFISPLIYIFGLIFV